MYNVLDVAKYIITRCSKHGCPISNLKLQKILYYAWIDYYKETGNELFVDDICAWQFGPVVPEVYYEFCTYAGAPISKEYDIDIDSEDIPILNAIIDKYLSVSASALVNRTHKQGGAWDRVFQDGIGSRNVIPFWLIRDLECGEIKC